MFDKTRLMLAFNRAVDAHLKSGKAKTQLRPHILDMVGPMPADPDLPGFVFHQVWYENGMMFVQPESGIAAIVHGYTRLVALETGNASLIEDSFFKPDPTPTRAKGK